MGGDGGVSGGGGSSGGRTQNAQLSLHMLSKSCVLHLVSLSMGLFSWLWQNAASSFSHGSGSGEAGGAGGGGCDGDSGIVG